MVVREPAGEGELRAAWQVLVRSFNFPPANEESWLASIGPLERCLVAIQDGEVAAFARIRPFGQYFGGRSVPMGGYSPVGVAPEHRGRGLAARITAAHYPALRERGECIAGLYPATTRLYRTVGFELGAVWSDRRFPIRSLQHLAPSGVTARRAIQADIPAIQACYRSVAPAHSGWLDRPEVWWNRILVEPWDDLHVYVVDGDDPSEADRVAGYIVYRQQADPDRQFGYQINVAEVVTADVEVAIALWRLVGSSSSMVDTVTVHGPPEHPLLFLLREQDIRSRAEIRYMLRVIDAPAAVAARGFPPVSATVDLELSDRHCDWNEGRWSLEVADGRGQLVKVRNSRRACPRLTTNAFASLYAGYASARTLAHVGLVTGATERDLAALDAVFSGPTPWLTDFF